MRREMAKKQKSSAQQESCEPPEYKGIIANAMVSSSKKVVDGIKTTSKFMEGKVQETGAGCKKRLTPSVTLNFSTFTPKGKREKALNWMVGAYGVGGSVLVKVVEVGVKFSRMTHHVPMVKRFVKFAAKKVVGKEAVAASEYASGMICAALNEETNNLVATIAKEAGDVCGHKFGAGVGQVTERFVGKTLEVDMKLVKVIANI